MTRRLSILAFFLASILMTGCVGTLVPTESPTPTSDAPVPTATSLSSAGPVLGTPASSLRGPMSLPDIASVVERAAPGVVSIIATVTGRDLFGRPFESQSQGSGVVFHEEGYILTNNHVVENATEVVAHFVNGESERATVVGTDPLTDLAVLKVNPGEVRDLVAVPLGDTQRMRVGDWVVAIGNPLGFEGTVTVGVISAKERSLDVGNPEDLYDLVQTDAVINPGNSGGPLLNLAGEVIGINTAIIRGRLRSGQEAEGIGFAISTTTAAPVARQIIENGEVVRPQIGVRLADVTPALASERDLSVDRGVLVVEVISGGPAEGAGIEVGDVITRIDDHEITTFTDIQRLRITRYGVGDKVTLTVVRGSEELKIDVTLGRA